jgi:flagellar hook assembly protein FlgD
VTSQAPGDPWQVADAAPNPSAGPVRLSWTALGADRPRRVEVLDVHGRRVRSIELQEDAGSADLLWDSLDDAGRRVPSGVYWLALESGRRRIVARPVRIVR